MSREMKFRGWDTRKNVMYSANTMGQDQLTLSVDGRGFINVSGRSTKLSTFPTHIIPMQYTGLKDKDRVEGYYQDITEDSNGDRYEVAWDEDDATYYLRATGLNVCDKELRAIKEQKVIGNIHQHPELLETKP